MRSVAVVLLAIGLFRGLAHGGSVRLDELNTHLMIAGWGTPQVDKDVQGKPMVIAGHVHEHGVGTHAPSLGVVALDGKAERFVAMVGVTDGLPEGGSVEFIIYGDDRILFHSGIVRGGEAARPVDVSLAGIQVLKLQVTDGGDGINSDHANWADARITFGGNLPEMIDPGADYEPESLYPPLSKRRASPGHQIYYVDPNKGDDANSGMDPAKPWQTFIPVNAMAFAPGDRIEILGPGKFMESLMPMGNGTPTDPIRIHFASGEYDFYPARALKLKLQISNTNDDPQTPKAIALAFQGIKHVQVEGGGEGKSTDIYVHGKMIQTFFDHAEDVKLQGLGFDYRRPTVSEYTVGEVAADHADLQIHPDSQYAVEKDHLVWIGEGWGYSAPGFSQQGDPALGTLWRSGNPLSGCSKVQEISPDHVRAWFKSNPGFITGRVFEDRNTFRDCAGSFARNSKDLAWKNCDYYYMHGLGLVSQFCENITVDHVRCAPREGSGRTAACWADAIHVSGCRGKFIADGCVFSGLQDDPINVHGTHLRIVGRPAANQLLVQFMQPQTFGFAAFFADDEIALTHHDSLLEFSRNKVTQAVMKGDKQMLLTLEKPASEDIQSNDVVENLTWNPEVDIRNCAVAMDSCRGFLLSTRRKALVENNTFTRTTMSAILIADDANSWFESGPVRDLTIRGNHFIHCAEPVISISPENRTTTEPVHENIHIEQNEFQLDGGSAVSAKSVRGLVVTGNRFSSASLPIQQQACQEVTIADNKLNQRWPDSKP